MSDYACECGGLFVWRTKTFYAGRGPLPGQYQCVNCCKPAPPTIPPFWDNRPRPLSEFWPFRPEDAQHDITPVLKEYMDDTLGSVKP